MESSNYNTATATAWMGNRNYMPAAIDLDDSQAAPGLRMQVLRTARERQVIASLRRHAAFGVEQDLGLGLVPFEQTRDEIGLVTAVSREQKLLATLRFVPTGHRLTGAERLRDAIEFDSSILGKGSWEVGRMIMEPEDRHPDLLLQCLAVTLEELMQLEDVRHFHATTTLAMARLWRRVGMRTVVTTCGASGTKYALVHGTVEAVAAALQQTQAGPAESHAALPAQLVMRAQPAHHGLHA
jgi:hypothetical protein